MKNIAFVVTTLFGGLALAQPSAPPPKQAVVEAEVLLVGCAPFKGLCGRVATQQPMALKVTKVSSGPLKVGDTPVVSVLTCFPGPLLHQPDPKEPFVELDPAQIRNGSKIKLELDIGLGSHGATTDNITVLKL